MVDSLLRGALGLGVLVMVAGIVAAPLTGSDRAFEFAPVLSAARGMWGWVSQSGQNANKVESNPQPFTTEATAAGDRLQKATAKALEQSSISADPRLSICPKGSREEQAREAPETTALALKQQAQGKKLTLLDLQGALGQPACNYKTGKTRVQRWLIAGGRVAIARSDDEKNLTVEFINF